MNREEEKEKEEEQGEEVEDSNAAIYILYFLHSNINYGTF